jgi:hypothetical protein
LLLVFDANHVSANDPYFTEILAYCKESMEEQFAGSKLFESKIPSQISLQLSLETADFREEERCKCSETL